MDTYVLVDSNTTVCAVSYPGYYCAVEDDYYINEPYYYGAISGIT